MFLAHRKHNPFLASSKIAAQLRDAHGHPLNELPSKRFLRSASSAIRRLPGAQDRHTPCGGVKSDALSRRCETRRSNLVGHLKLAKGIALFVPSASSLPPKNQRAAGRENPPPGNTTSTQHPCAASRSPGKQNPQVTFQACSKFARLCPEASQRKRKVGSLSNQPASNGVLRVMLY